jgi:two-component system, OmpR family, phosphate regulon sensor histidine kinase PhoR
LLCPPFRHEGVKCGCYVSSRMNEVTNMAMTKSSEPLWMSAKANDDLVDTIPPSLHRLFFRALRMWLRLLPRLSFKNLSGPHLAIGICVGLVFVALVCALTAPAYAFLPSTAALFSLPATAFYLVRSRPHWFSKRGQNADLLNSLGTANLLEASPEPVFILDHALGIRFANKRAHKFFGPFHLFDSFDSVFEYEDLTRLVQTTAETNHPGVLDYVDHSSSVERNFEVHVTPLRIQVQDRKGAMHVASRRRDRRSDAVAVVFRDLTQQRRVEKMRADFIANASHELRTPLAALTGFIETLLGPARNDPNARDKFLDIMRQQAERMNRLINDLLSLSRIEINAHIQPETPVELVGAVRQVVDANQPLAEKWGVTLRFNCDLEEVVVMGDRDELMRVAENLTQNAIRYGQSGKFVDVSLTTEPPLEGQRRGTAVLGIRDYGPGIAPEHLPRLTERFYRANENESRAKGGTGLGLAIVKHIINRHRGKFDIQSTLGEGACFMARFELLALDDMDQSGSQS